MSLSSTRFTRKFAAQCGAEFFGTLFLAEIVGCIAVNDSTMGNGPIGIGFALGLLIYAFGHISGGHLNPAVTLALVIRGACDPFTGVFYWISQIIGGLIGAAISKFLAEEGVALQKGAEYSTGEAVSAEIFFTFLLCTVVINVATTKANKGNPFFGFAIGATVTSAAYSVGEISGGAFNPAVATGISASGGTSESLWVYWIGEILGAIFAGLSWYVLNFEEAADEKRASQRGGSDRIIDDNDNINNNNNNDNIDVNMNETIDNNNNNNNTKNNSSNMNSNINSQNTNKLEIDAQIDNEQIVNVDTGKPISNDADQE
jgi:aquaporin Z